MIEIEKLDPASYRRAPWKNGGGTSVIIAETGGAWDATTRTWQLSRTSIIAPGPFSDHSGFERLQVVIKGSGLVLVTANGEIDLRAAFRPQRYDGGLPLTTRLENGVVEVVNLIASKATCRIDLRVGNAGDVLSCPAGEHIVHAPTNAGGIKINGEACMLEQDAAARFTCNTAIDIAVTGGVVLIASIYPA